MFVEAVKLIGILLATIVMYIVAGLTANIFICGDKFDVKILFTGIIKAVIACISLIVLAYISSSDIIDLSSIGFQPKTFISSGILLYASKLLSNVAKLIGIGKKTDVTSEELASKVEEVLFSKASKKITEKKNEVIDENNAVG